MCGIAGIIGFEDKALLRRMCKTIAHRGPDDEGFFFDKGVGLGHRRLSIIDLAGGHQPMSNEDGSVWVVFNGEIFNFRELRRELEGRGHRFRTNSDTEVLVHGYEEYGMGIPNRLRGMFAFALWDCKKKSLMLARDRLGINPLYYTMFRGSLVFASEIKAILQCGEIERKVNYSALGDYLRYQVAIGPNTMFEGILELLPGHILVFGEGRPKVSRYWDITDFTFKGIPEEKAVKLLLGQLRNAVSSHLESDVPVGLYLSGGVDSSTLLALMRETYKGDIQAFSVGFGFTETDELGYSRKAAERFGAVHNEITIETGMVLGDMEAIVGALEDPIADFGEFANFYLSREVNKAGLKVVLCGGGSDELFAGYQGHARAPMLEKARVAVPRLLRKRLLPAVGSRIPLWFPKSLGLNTYIEHLAEDSYGTNGQLFPTAYERRMLFPKGAGKITCGSERVGGYYLNPAIPEGQAMTRAQYVDLKVYVDEHQLHVDKMNLRHAVEVRYPLLDYRLVEFSFRLPPPLRIRDSVEKYVMRKVAQRLDVPKEIIWKKKKGFRSPLERWLSGDMRSFAQDAIERSELIRKTMNMEYIRRLFGRTKDHWYAHKVWGLMVLALWHKIYFEE